MSAVQLDSVEDYERKTEISPYALPGATTASFLTTTGSLIQRMGAKSQLAGWLVEQFPPCYCYVEPFFATGRVLFTKPRKDRVEIVNDFESDLIEFWRWVQADPLTLLRTIRGIPTHEAVILGLRGNLARHELKGVERAAGWYIAAQSAFNAKGSYSSVNITPYQSLAASLQSLTEADVTACFRRLSQVVIRSRSFQDLITYTNKPLPPDKYPPGGVFYYLDPPYWATAGYQTMDKAGEGFPWKYQVELADLCAAIDEVGNRFIETNSYHQDLVKLYGGYKRADGSPRFLVTKRDVKYTMAGGQGDLFQEAIISNFPLRGESKRQTGLFTN